MKSDIMKAAIAKIRKDLREHGGKSFAPAPARAAPPPPEDDEPAAPPKEPTGADIFKDTEAALKTKRR